MMLFTSLSAVLAALMLAVSNSAGEVSGRPLGHWTPSDRPLVRADSTPLYTEEQATAGAVLFGRVCAECHEKKDLTKADFRAKWTGRPILDLFELVRTTMPDSNPGGLSRDEYAGALAYILKLNGLPAGDTPVMPDSSAMKNVKLELPPPAP
ncbi:MAG: cytochrome c [Gemmatimonadaceae bacterium]|nr:cytochrome c [Gemmatimonadaceae bacterium]